MKSSILTPNILKSVEIEIDNGGNNYICKMQIINDMLNISLYNNIIKYEGNITLNEIKNQIAAFNDYNIYEIFEEINILNNKSFILIKEKDNKYKLKLKFIILRRKKYLYINLYENGKEDYIKYISELKEIIRKKDEQIKLLEDKLKKYKNDEEIENNFNFDIKLKEPINIIINHIEYVYCLTILKDGRLVSGSYDNSIIIYNKETYKPDLIIKEHKDPIFCITTLNSGILASCSADKTIKLYYIKDHEYNILQTLNYHKDYVFKIIELRNKSLVSCSFDESIIFYNKDNNNKYAKDYNISTNGQWTSVIQTKENELCYSEEINDSICFYDFNQRKKILSINNINKLNSESEWFIMINKDLLLIPGENKISIININKYKLERIININGSGWIRGICMLNENILLTGDENKIIKEWKIEGNNLILISQKEKAHNDCINHLINLGNGHIASASDDKTIKIW